MTSFAPCRCGKMIYEIPLTGHNEPDGEGGTWWEVVPGANCLDCGEPLLWLHKPAPDELVWDFSTVKENVDVTQPVSPKENL